VDIGASALSEQDDRDDFFAKLPEVVSFADVTSPRSYHAAPPTWRVVITDVCGSTRAIEAGRYKDVNALGAGCIIAVRNALADVHVPYVFGGDGATLLVPGSAVARAEVALRGLQQIAREAFSMELRAGVVPVGDLLSRGHRVGVARFRASPHLCLAMFAGSGFSAAERWVKDGEGGGRYAVADGEAHANLEGFECRWQPVPSRHGHVVSLLVLAWGERDEDRALAYARVLARLDSLRDPESARPVSVAGLRLGTLGSDYSTEARLRSGQAAGEAYDRARRHARHKTLIGGALRTLGASAGGFDGKRYPRELVENTDFRKFDETLRMVLDLSDADCQSLEAFLEAERSAGRLSYGLHRADSALVTCFVRSYDGDHLHFVDGSDGGYALAAKQLKRQVAAREGRA
jgi:hypothetical protein